MTTVAQLIIDKLTSIDERLARLEEKVNGLDASFLYEEVKNEATAIVRTPRKRTAHAKHLPPRFARQLKDENDLTENTRNTYSSTLKRLAAADIDFVPTLIAERNKGVPYAKIAHKSEKLFGRKYSEKTLANMLSVGLRFDIIERTPDRKYVTGPAFKDLKA